ncbi:MAG: hypothetical protein NTX26_02615, partial [Candidatus Parcubacteria bacterium]|nr:hypothetical protein [Candidatus Parcubacteria bacterium]
IVNSMKIVNCKLKILLLVLLSFVLVFISVSYATAAELTFSPPQLVRGTSDTYAVDLILDTQGEDINVLEASLSYPLESFTLKDVLTGDSVINFWIKPPGLQEEQKDLIYFAGSIPAGYTGSQGKVITLLLQPQLAGAVLNLGIVSDKDNPSRVFLNDSLATEEIIPAHSLSFNLSSPGSNGGVINLTDKIKPDMFSIAIASSNTLPLNNVFIVFHTDDNGSGIDHYEMAQANTAEEFSSNANLLWQKVISPAVINLAQAQRFLAIKAFDHSNNFEISVVDLKPSQNKAVFQNPFTVAVILSIMILLILNFIFYSRRRKNK